MNTSSNRYAIFKTQRLPKRKKTIRLSGDLEDSNRYFRCWNCGFICDSERDQVGDGDGVTVLDTPEIARGGFGEGDPVSAVAMVTGHCIVLETGPDGNPKTKYEHNQYPQIIGGCPLCGSKNYM